MTVVIKTPTFRSPERRNLMRFVLALDPTILPCLGKMIAMGVKDIHPDHMYVNHPDSSKPFGSQYHRMDDPGAWNGYIMLPVGMRGQGVSLIRGRDGKWFLNGF